MISDDMYENIQQARADQAAQARVDRAKGRKPLRPVAFLPAVDLLRRVVDQLPPTMTVEELISELGP